MKFFDMMRREARRREEEAREYDSTSGKEKKKGPPREAAKAGGWPVYKSLTSEGARWMPWLPEAKKDVISHERPRRGASDR